MNIFDLAQCKWQVKVKKILDALKDLNNDYNESKNNHIKINNIKCIKCGKAAFVARARNPSDTGQMVSFKLDGWKCNEYGDYTCEDCK